MNNQEIDFQVGVVLPAAGSGERLKNFIPKQYFEIQGKPLFLYAVEEFEAIPWISHIIIAADNITRVENILGQRTESSGKITVAQGGNTRHRSIQAGLAALQIEDSECDVVVVHDAVRPLIPPSLLLNLVQAAHQFGAAGATRPLISTVVAGNEQGFLAETLNRSKYLNSETPQAFKTSVLVDAYQKITDKELDEGTECLQLVLQHCNIRAKLVPGPEELWKVTLKRDLHSAIGCITALQSQVCILNYCSNEAEPVISSLINSLQSRVSTIQHITPNSCSNGHTTIIYNKIIVFSSKETQSIPLSSLIDNSIPGFILHIIHNNNIQDNKSELYKNGSQIINNNTEKYNTDVAVIYCNSQIKESQKLIAMICSVILSDNAFAGQILFI